MATRVVAGGELLGAEELERELAALISHVQREKETVRSSFQQIHSLLAVKEHSLLQELDGIVGRAIHELAEKRETLKELDTAREGLERDLTKNKLQDLLEKHLRALEDKIREELSRGVSVGWVELCWKKEQLEQSVCEVCEVVTLKERPFMTEDYSLKLRPVWSRDATAPGEINWPRQIAVDSTTQNIFVTDLPNTIQVFTEEGKHLYSIPTAESPAGIALTEEYIFVSAGDQLVKIRKSNNKSVKSVKTENRVWGMDIDANTNIYVCEYSNKSVIVFDKNLKFLKRIKLQTSQITSDTETNSLKLCKDRMYVMFGRSPPPFHLQIFSLEGELVKCLIPDSEIVLSFFFSIDSLGNIIVADWGRSRIKIFNKEGESIHTITSDMLPGDMELCYPRGIAINRNNRIIVAQKNKECCLLAF